MSRLHKGSKALLLRGLIILPVIIFSIPADIIEAHPMPCLFRALFGIKCIGCGITRATVNLIHFNLSRAYSYNRLVFIIFPIMAWLYIKMLLKLYDEIKSEKHSYKN